MAADHFLNVRDEAKKNIVLFFIWIIFILGPIAIGKLPL